MFVYREHIWCTYIKSDVLILDPTLLEKLEDSGLFVKITSYSGEIFFLRYRNRVRYEFDRLDLIRAPMSYVH
jgi:hypothetical protein